MRPRSRLLASLLIVSAAAGFSPGAAGEPPAGSKNFSTPATVPNYFSNEAGPALRNPAPLPTIPAASTNLSPGHAAPGPPAPALEGQPRRRIITIVTSRARSQAAPASGRTVTRAVQPLSGARAADRRRPLLAASGGAHRSWRTTSRNAANGRPSATKMRHEGRG